jgi:lipopolysaccharide heptosyltransferase II
MSDEDLLRSAVGADALGESLRTDPPRRILVVVRSHIGDAVMSTGAVNAIGDRFPHARITLETSRRAMPVFDNFPRIDARRIRSNRWEKTTSVWWLRRSRRFDLAIILDDSRRRARIARWGGLHRIVGVREDDVDERFTASVRWSAGGHDLFDSLRAVLVLLGAPVTLQPRIFATDALRSQARRALGPSGDRPLVGLFVDAAWAEKRWPLDRFLDLAARLDRAGFDVVAFSGLGRDDLLQSFRAHRLRTVDTLDHPLALAEAIRGLAALVTNDTSAAHLADVVDTPAVIIYGPTSPARFAPYGGGHRLLHGAFDCDLFLRRCDAKAAIGQCDRRCIRAIDVDQVFEAATAIAAAAPSQRAVELEYRSS